jgi:serine/threonine-protein kinase
MGVVYKAKDPTIGRTVALKTMRLDTHGLDSGELLRRFQNEARAAGLLNHPNIVTIYDAGEQDGMFYIAMEFIEGTTLQELLMQKQTLPVDEAVQISSDICEGLDYAHSNGIVHRDVKPANIMITAQGAVKIMDFGIAKAGGSMTSTGHVLGTPNYMSPEQVKGKPLDGRSDLFSLGVVLYEMLTGEKPFVGQNVTTVIYKIVNENPISPRDLDVTVHPGLSHIVIKTLAKSPDERYQSGAELVRDLEHYKSAGSTLRATTMLPQAAAQSHERTVVLPMRVVSGSAVRATAAAPRPIREPVPLRQRGPAGHSNRETWLFAIILLVLLGGAAAGGYAYYRTRSQAQKPEAEAKANQAQASTLQPSQAVSSPSPPAAAPAASETPGGAKTASEDANETLENKPADPSPFNPKKLVPRPSIVPPGGISFSSRPDGAKVNIDGAADPAWITPFKSQHLAPGTHSVVFSKDGYLRETRSIEVVAGKSTPVDVALTPAAKLVVTSNPPGAGIWVDGQDTGMVTPSQLMLAKGLHRIRLKKAGYREGFWEGNLPAGQTVSFNSVLLSENQSSEKGPSPSFFSRFLGTDAIPDGKGLVHIRTVPEGATIIVDGRVAPKKTNARWPAEPGIHSIELQLEGYKSIHRNIRVVQGQISPIDEILEKQ